MNRRDFIHLSASAGAISLLQAHTLFATSGCFVANAVSREPRITMLRLETIASLEEMKKFYAETIGLPVSATDRELTVQAGETQISFTKVAADKRPFYHFAFNIPENKIQSAFDWQRQKTPLVRPGVNSIVNFNHWNAHSIFFLDPAGNLLEYIARHDLKNAAEGVFSVKDILYASEIAFIVDDVVSSGNALKKEMSLSEYRDVSPGFWPIGDEYGLLLMIQKGKVWASHPDQVNETAVFNTSVTIRTANKNGWTFPNYPYEIKALT